MTRSKVTVNREMNDHVGDDADSNDGTRQQTASLVTSETDTATDSLVNADSTDLPYCMTACKYGRTDTGYMARCCMCYHWYHEDCVKTDKSQDAHWWLCYACRGMSRRVSVLETSILPLTTTVQELATVNAELSSNNEHLVAEIRKLNSEQKVRFESMDSAGCKC